MAWAELGAAAPRALRYHWCPGHGRNRWWDANVPHHLSPEVVRELNDLADQRATERLREIWPRGDLARIAEDEAHRWTRKALWRQHGGPHWPGAGRVADYPRLGGP